MRTAIAVACDPHEGGWRCTVTIGTDADATTHTVAVDRETLDDLAAGATPAQLVRTAFEFLLEREPRESIMRSFELPIISRFFAEFTDEMHRRLRSERGAGADSTTTGHRRVGDPEPGTE